MQEFPLQKPRPDFKDLIQVLAGRKEPDKVPLCEMLIDEEIKCHIIEHYFNEVNYPPTVTFGGSAEGDSRANKDHRETMEASRKYYRQLIDFYYRMGYSFVADYEFLVNFQAFNTVARIGKDPDTSEFARGERHWAQEGKGVIKSWEDFERFPWGEARALVQRYADHLEFLEKHLYDGMKVAVVGSVLEQVMEWLLGYEGVLYNVYDDPEFVTAVFNEVGKLVYDLYMIAAPMKGVGVIWHGDDIGFQTATMLSPDHLRRWVFPWLKKYAGIAHSYGKPIWYHACGNKNQVMKDFIEDIGFDAIHSFEDSSNPVTEYKKRYGDRIALLGGVDIDKLVRLEEEELRGYVRNILDICMPGGRYALGSGNSVCNFVPVNNFLIMLDEGMHYR
jgi:uroporphyrinogen decarboxylase